MSDEARDAAYERDMWAAHGSPCRTGCKTQDHTSYAECLTACNIQKREGGGDGAWIVIDRCNCHQPRLCGVFRTEVEALRLALRLSECGPAEVDFREWGFINEW